MAESFFATLKRELLPNVTWATRDEARTAVFEYIEVWYNRQRRHSSLGYLSQQQSTPEPARYACWSATIPQGQETPA